MNWSEIIKRGEGQRLEFKLSFGIQTELKNLPEVSFSIESVNSFTRSNLNATSTQTPHVEDATPHVKDVALADNQGVAFRSSDVTPHVKDATPHVTPHAEDATPHVEYVTPQDTPQDTHQDTPQDDFDKMVLIRDLVAKLEGEMSRRELQHVLQLQDRFHFRLSYLTPAIKHDLIEMTIPEKPKSVNQKYRLTKKGKRMKEKILGQAGSE